jgi:hypothetical protein
VDQEPQPEKQLTAERQAHTEARRLLAAALERIPPQIEAPGSPGAPGSPESPRGGHDSMAEGVERVDPRSAGGGLQRASERPRERRGLWQRLFGG